MLKNLIAATAVALWIISAALAQPMPAVNSTPPGCGTSGIPMTSAGGTWNCAYPKGTNLIFEAKAVNLGATGDQATISVPSSLTRYQITGVSVTNCSTTPVLAQVAVYTGAGATGTNVVGAGTVTGASSAGVILPLTLTGSVATTMLTSASLFVNVPVANVAALTCDVGIKVQDWT